MSNIIDVFELVDISSEEEGKKRHHDRKGKDFYPVPRNYQENYRIVLEVSHSSTGALADEEEYFDIS